MSIDVTLQDPDNASNPTSLEQVIAENNAALKAALSKALSKDGGTPNFMNADLDLNGYSLINVGESVFLTRSDLSEVQAGEFQKNPTTGDLEYREPGQTSWTVLYTAAELQGPPGTGNGDLEAANNLSDVADASTARTNLGLQIGTDIPAYDANLDGFDPATKADLTDPRFSKFTVTNFTTSTTANNVGNLYVFSGAAVSQTLTIPPGTIGDVTTVYVAPTAADLTISTALNFFKSGETASSSSLTIGTGGLVSIICISNDGQQFVVSGTNVT